MLLVAVFLHVNIDSELSSDKFLSIFTRCIHKRRLGNDTSESSSTGEGLRSKKKKSQITRTTMKK